MVTTPLGWVFVIGAGLAAGYGAASISDNAAKWVAGKTYDISEHLNWF